MITIKRNPEEMKAAFLANATSHEGLLVIKLEDYEKIAANSVHTFSIRVDEDLSLEEELDIVYKEIDKEYETEPARMVVCLEYAPNEELMMDEMNFVHEFVNNFNEDMQIIWGLAKNKELCNKRAVEVFCFGAE